WGGAPGPYPGVGSAGPWGARRPMAGRLVLCNRVIDFGAKTGYIQPDETRARWLAERAGGRRWTAETTDSDTDYGRIVDLDVGEIEPLVAVPHDPTDIREASA